MGLFVLIGRDGPGGRALRGLHREAHLRNLAPLDAAGRVAYAGPLLDEQGAPTGSVIVFEADDLAAARRFAETDPYVVEGVFERFELFESRRVFPAEADAS
jgi:uncharacterized protein YciI